MPTPGPLELVIILVIALLILGPGKLPDVGSALGKSIREFRKASSDVQEAVTLNVDTSPLPATPAPAPVVQAAAAPAPAPAAAPAPVADATPVAPTAAAAPVEADTGAGSAGAVGATGAASATGAGVAATAAATAAAGAAGAAGAACGAGVAGSGDVSTLRVTASWTSDDALRNSLMLFPSAAPTSGSLPGPRMRSAITRMMTSSRGPGVGMIVVAPAGRTVRGAS